MQTPDTAEELVDVLRNVVDAQFRSLEYNYDDDDFADIDFNSLSKALVKAHNKKMAELVPRWDGPEDKPIPFNYHKNEDAVYAYVDGFNEARRLILGEEAQ